MSVGIYDADNAKYTHTVFNLEAMKLAAYYKKAGEIVTLMPQFDPSRHTKVIYRKDYDDGEYPSNLYASNVNYGGYAFTNGLYVPLPLEVEQMRPDCELYRRQEQAFRTTSGIAEKDRLRLFNDLIYGEHCRLSLDGLTLWSDFSRQLRDIGATRNIFFHDFNLNRIEGGYETAKDLFEMARKKRKIVKLGSKFPIEVSNGADLKKWMALDFNPLFLTVQYNGVMENDLFIEWLATVTKLDGFSSLQYYVTDGSTFEQQFIQHELPKLFYQVSLARMRGANFLLIYDDAFFTNSDWGSLLKIFNQFLANNYHAGYSEDDTFVNYIKRCIWQSQQTYRKLETGFKREDYQRIFNLVRTENYDLFCEFYTCSPKTIGEKLRNDRQTD